MAVAAVKTGMLGSGETVEIVARELERAGCVNLVVDPVIRSSSGDRLLDEGGVAALRERLLPMSAIFTPNIPEAESLLGGSIDGRAGMAERPASWSPGSARGAAEGRPFSGDCPDLLFHGGDALDRGCEDRGGAPMDRVRALGFKPQPRPRSLSRTACPAAKESSLVPWRCGGRHGHLLGRPGRGARIAS